MANTSSSEKPLNSGREISVYALVWLVALAARLVYWWQIKQAPVFTLLMGDGASYDAWARQIANGDWLGKGVFYQAPLYPYFLGVVYALFGTNLLVVRGIQIAIGATSCVLLAHAGRSFFSRATGLLAALILAVYPTAIFFDCSIQKSVLDLFFVCALLAITGRLSERTKPSYSVRHPRAVITWVPLFSARPSLASSRTGRKLQPSVAATASKPSEGSPTNASADGSRTMAAASARRARG